MVLLRLPKALVLTENMCRLVGARVVLEDYDMPISVSARPMKCHVDSPECLQKVEIISGIASASEI